MRKSARSEQARRSLDAKFRSGSIQDIRARPRSGWIRSVRVALGMTQEALAKRLGITRNAVAKLEISETNGGLTIGKLSEVARALDCTLVYALVPNTTLEDTVQRQAADVVTGELGYVGATMALEGQAISDEQRDAAFRRHVEAAVDRGNIWRT